MKTINRFLSVSVLAGLLAGAFIAPRPAEAQATLASTTLNGAITNRQSTVTLTSASGILGPGQPTANGAIDAPSNSNIYLLYVDKEAMEVAATPNGNIVSVRRGAQGTRAVSHNSGATVWNGPSAYFGRIDPTGSCTATNLTVLPVVAILTGNVWTCPTTAPNSGQWTRQAVADYVTFGTATVPDETFWVPPTACQEAASAGAGTGDGTLILDGSVPALKGATSGSGNLVFSCTIFVPSRLTSGKGFTITDLTYMYSVQTNAATSMVASTFKAFTAPAPAASETASSATLVAQGGTLTQTPAIASANLSAVSAGQYYSEKVALATPVTVNTDRQGFVFTFQLNQSAGATATVVTTPGILVHGIENPL